MEGNMSGELARALDPMGVVADALSGPPDSPSWPIGGAGISNPPVGVDDGERAEFVSANVMVRADVQDGEASHDELICDEPPVTAPPERL